MAEIKTLASIRDKYARVTPGRTEDYANGIAGPSKDWADVTGKANEAYKQGVQDAITRNAFQKGVVKAGTGKWQVRAASVGVERWGPGVRAGVEAYEKGFAPFQEVIARTTLPVRYPSGDPRNYARVQAIGEALRKARVGSAGK